jgi:transcriptional regulator with XRE-family HTH domain
MGFGISERIKAARKNANITLKELAMRIGVSEAQAQRYESGQIGGLRLDRVENIGKILGVSAEYLMGWSETQKKYIDVTELTNTEIKDVKEYINYLKSKRGVENE